MIAGDVLLRPHLAWLAVFVVLAAAQPVLVLTGASRAAVVAAWVAVIPLVLWVWRSGGPRLLLGALALCWLGDVFGNPRQLGLGPGFVWISVAAFAAGAGCLIIAVARSRSAMAYVGCAIFVCWLILVGAEVVGAVAGSQLAFRIAAPAVYSTGLLVIAVGVVLSRTRRGGREFRRA